MEGSKRLEGLVAVVTTLGELAATVTVPHRSVRPPLYPESLDEDLRKFIWNLRDALEHGDVTSLRQRGVTSLSHVMAALGATPGAPGATWADARATARAWREQVDALRRSWDRLTVEAKKLFHALKDEDTNEDTSEDTDEDTDEDTNKDTDEDTDEDTNKDNAKDSAKDSAKDNSKDNAKDSAKDNAEATGLAGDVQDKTASEETPVNSVLVATCQAVVGLNLLIDMLWTRKQMSLEDSEEDSEEDEEATSQAGEATKRRQQVREAKKLLVRLVVACMSARLLSCELLRWLRDIEFNLQKRKEVSGCVPEALVVAVAKFEQLWEDSARLTTRHLLVTLRDIDILLSSPCGGSGWPVSPAGPVSPGGSSGPSGCSVAERCPEAIEDTARPTAPSCGKTNNGSSITGTPEQPERTWGNPEPGAVGETARHPPSDPDLLPPGARCELATSELMCFLNNSCHECIPIAVTGTSQQRQDFLIIGKDSNETLGLSVIPTVISVNCNEKLMVLALVHKAPLVIQAKTPIAIAIALPMDINKRAGYREMPLESFSPAPNIHWIKRIANERPELTCSLTHLGRTVHITGTLDTGSDVTVIPYEFWPRDWNLVTPTRGLTGIGGAAVCMQSESMITVTGPEGKTATTRPYVVKKRITLWGRDVLSQWRAKMEMES